MEWQQYLYNSFRQFVPLIPPKFHPYLELVVKRDDIFGRSVRDRLSELLRLPKSTLQKPLRVIFEGERGIDEGALSVEFFRLVFDEILDPEKNVLFRHINEDDPTQSQVWFREECPTKDTAMMCGLLFGMSLFNNALVQLPAFPQLLYAKLLGKGPKEEMEEIRELDKDFADRMSKLLHGTEEEVSGSRYDDEPELDNGGRVEVTKANVHRAIREGILSRRVTAGGFCRLPPAATS
ncbi:probable E3 ubiquitin-protein ligase HERC4 [Strongylocentrotus purpuratus]|uniref:HECT-type E3 ubiquitin transferase n=1 Tax=Strongylocentrotus purpuratus TaxID=7668 RepID=A0A7M7NIQ7_STRPU|nr:probable E3 ubiquitin-protein ligase HERC4 [Strongylocentrotus purpuratus]